MIFARVQHLLMCLEALEIATLHEPTGNIRATLKEHAALLADNIMTPVALLIQDS